MAFKIDLSKVKTLEAVPDGDYVCTLTGSELVQKKEKAPYMKLEMTIQDDDFPDLKGRKLFRNLSLSDEAQWAFKEALVAFDCDPDDLESEIDVEDTVKSLYGNQALVSTVQEEYKEKMRAQVKKISALGY